MHDLVPLKLNVMKRNLVALLSERPSYIRSFADIRKSQLQRNLFEYI